MDIPDIQKEIDRALANLYGQSPEKRKAIPKIIKNEVMVRQKYKCKNCGEMLPATKHFHHKVTVSEGGKPTLDNIIALCPDCHADWHHQSQLKKSTQEEESKSGVQKAVDEWYELVDESF